MKRFPDAYVIPVGNGQRSDAEAKRLVGWLLRNGIEVETLRFGGSFSGGTLRTGARTSSRMDQAHRGLADRRSTSASTSPTGCSSTRLRRRGAGYLWGADIVEIPLGSGFSPVTTPLSKTVTPPGGVEPGRAEAYALEGSTRRLRCGR